jgi:hypothetical protein
LAAYDGAGHPLMPLRGHPVMPLRGSAVRSRRHEATSPTGRASDSQNQYDERVSPLE